MTSTIIILVLLYSNPSCSNKTIEETVDLIELNHKYDTDGQHMFDQIIYWEHDPSNGRYYVRAWHMVGPQSANVNYPTHNHKTETWEVFWFDQSEQLNRKVKSKIYRETWTKNDPERDDLKIMPEQYRRKLTTRKIAKFTLTLTPEHN